jgi:hypothetical protein
MRSKAERQLRKAARQRRMEEYVKNHVPKYRYGTGGWNKEYVVYAYTQEEWGLGGHSATESSNMANSVIGQSLVALIMTVPAILAPFGIPFGILTVIMSFPDLGDMGMGVVLTLLFAFLTLICTGGWLASTAVLRKEWRARKLRKPKGLPKPMYEVTDDKARRWFEKNPGILDITRENFPYSTYPFPGEPGFVAPKED